MRLMMDLPSEILMEIFKRLPVKSVYRLRCVSKTLLDVIDSPSFVSLHSRSLIASNGVAEESLLRLRLVRSYCKTTRRNFTALQSLNYDAGEGKLTSSDILSTFKSSHLHFVFNNLFCWEIGLGRDALCFLIDPFREEVLRLPTSGMLVKKGFYGMGFDNITSTYKIVILSRHSKCKTRLAGQVHVVGTSSWHEIPSPPFALSLDQSHHYKSLCAYGDMHWVFHADSKGLNHIISFDFTKEEFYSTPYPAALSTERNLRYITLKGSMAILKVNPTTAIDIWVMKDHKTKEWTREYNINLQILGRDLQDMLYRASCDEWENGIVFISYVTMVESDISLFFYLRHVPMNYVARQIEESEQVTSCEKIWCCKRSLISQKEFGKLVEEPEALSHSLLDFSRKYLRSNLTKGYQSKLRK